MDRIWEGEQPRGSRESSLEMPVVWLRDLVILSWNELSDKALCVQEGSLLTMCLLLQWHMHFQPGGLVKMQGLTQQGRGGPRDCISHRLQAHAAAPGDAQPRRAWSVARCGGSVWFSKISGNSHKIRWGLQWFQCGKEGDLEVSGDCLMFLS